MWFWPLFFCMVCYIDKATPMGFDWDDIAGGIKKGITPFLPPGIRLIIENGGGGGNSNNNQDDDIPDPFQAIGDAFSSPYVKIGLLAAAGYLAYSMLKDDK